MGKMNYYYGDTGLVFILYRNNEKQNIESGGEGPAGRFRMSYKCI